MQQIGHPTAIRRHELVTVAEEIERVHQAAPPRIIAEPAIAAHELEPLAQRGRVVACQGMVRGERMAGSGVVRIRVEGCTDPREIRRFGDDRRERVDRTQRREPDMSGLERCQPLDRIARLGELAPGESKLG